MREPTVAQRRAVEINPNNQWNQADMAIVLMAGEVAAPRRAVRMKPADTTGLTWVEEVLGYWFGELGEAHWFDENEEIDEQIRARFRELHERVASGDGLDVTTPRAMLAAVLVVDQFPRNMFRGTPRAFETDPVARRLARQAIAERLDASMTDEERMFLYLPFQHSEDREDQALSVELFTRLGNEVWTRYALAHQSVIDRFGRFPHRNAILGRDSTADEVAVLREPMGSF